jgi:flagellar biosynthesis/type III secretory pathway protein FliH
LFNPTPQRAAQPAWSPDALLKPVPKGDGRFASQDWEDVPRLDYHTEQFRQLAVRDPARVVEDASGFETWQPKQVGAGKFLNEAEALKAEAAEAANAALRAREGEPGEGESTDLLRDESAASEDFQPASDPIAGQASDEATEALAEQDDSARHESAPAMHADPLMADVQDTEATPESMPAAADASTPEEAPADEMSTAQTPLDEDGTVNEAGAPEAPPALLDSEAVQQACEAARQEGHAQGLQAGHAAGLEEAGAQARETLEAALMQADVDKTQALQALREELEGELEPIKQQLAKLIEQTQALVAKPDALYEPLKRLSLHLAEQLVLGELNLSSGPIQRLIQRCLDELDLHGNPTMVVELNPQDKARLQDHVSELAQNLSLQAVHTLQPGSVRVIVNDTMVEDLVGPRLEALARGLLVQPEAWREKSPFFRQPLAQRDTEVQDAPARASAAPTAPSGFDGDALRAGGAPEEDRGEHDA